MYQGCRCTARSLSQHKKWSECAAQHLLNSRWASIFYIANTVVIFVLKITLACKVLIPIIYHCIVVSPLHCSHHPLLSALFPLWQCFVRLAQVLVWSESCTPPAVQPPAGVRQKRELKQRGVTKKKRAWLYGYTAAEKISFMLKERKCHRGERELWLPAETVVSGWDWGFPAKSSCASLASVHPSQLALFCGWETLVIVCFQIDLRPIKYPCVLLEYTVNN